MRTGMLAEAGPASRARSLALPLQALIAPVSSWLTILHSAVAMVAADRSSLPRTSSNSLEGSGRAGPDGPAPFRRSGSPSFHETILPHLDAAYTLARFLTRDADASDDIVQEAFLRAFRAFEGFRGGDARAWLLSIVRNCVRSWAVERNRNRARSVPLAEAPHGEHRTEAEVEELWDPDQDTPESALLRDNEAGLIRRLIEALPDAFREVLVMREFDDLSYKQIAEITATPIGTVMSRLARARRMFGLAWRRHSAEGAA